MIFRREKDQPVMGPDGGNGGDGGNVYFLGSKHTKNLENLVKHFWKDPKNKSGKMAYFEKIEQPKNEIRGNDGLTGGTDHKKGRQGVDKFIKLPIGTLILDTGDDDDQIKFKNIILKHNQVILAAEKGFGGYGNKHFGCSTSTTPELAVPASEMKPPDDKHYFLTMLQVSHVNFLGYQGAGKSSLLQYLTDVSSTISTEGEQKSHLSYQRSSFNSKKSSNPGLGPGQFANQKIFENIIEESNSSKIEKYFPILGIYRKLNKIYGLNITLADYPDYNEENQEIKKIYRKFSLFSYLNYILIDVSQENAAQNLQEILENMPKICLNKTKIILNREPTFAEECFNFRNENYPDMDIYLLPYDLDEVETEIQETFLSVIENRRKRVAARITE